MSRLWLMLILFSLIAATLLKWGTFLVAAISYLLISNQISSLDVQAKTTAESEFYSQGKSDNIYAGVLAKINQLNQGRVWIWGNEGLKYFQADENSVFSYYIEVNSWADMVKAGNSRIE